jgi:hypothetical protein
MAGPITFPAGGNVPANVALISCSSGAAVPVSLLEVQLINGTRLYVSDAAISAIPAIAAFDPVQPVAAVAFQPWMLDPPSFKITNTLVTQTSNVTFQNTLGSTVARANSTMFSKMDFWGALWIYRLWQPATQYALFTARGDIADAYCDEKNVRLTLKDLMNFSEIVAPDCQIGPNCQNQFGSQQCGSTSPTQCQNTYGTCTSLNRFKAYISTWNGTVLSPNASTPIAQPVPAVVFNPKRSS